VNDISPEPGFDAIRCLSIPMAEKLATYAEWAAHNEPHYELLYDELIEQLGAADTTEYAPRKGTLLPPFHLPDTDGRLVHSREILERGPLVLSFNRGHWCSYCRLELLALEEIYTEVKDLGGTIISITPQRAPAANKLREICELTFPILCDVDNCYTLECGLMMSITPAIDSVYQKTGIDLAADQGNGGLFLPMPATYVVGRDGIIHADYIQPDFRTRMAPQDILAALRKISN